MNDLTRGSFLRFTGTVVAGAIVAPLFAGQAAAALASGTPAKGKVKRKYLMSVMTNSVAGCDADFNEWYTNRHVHDVVKVPGFVSAQRFKLAEDTPLVKPKYQYFSSYELDTDDLHASVTELMRRSGTPLMPLSENSRVNSAIESSSRSSPGDQPSSARKLTIASGR